MTDHKVQPPLFKREYPLGLLAPLQVGQVQSLPQSNPWEMPCPRQTAPDIADDHAINEWIFNHLALTPIQKETLLAMLRVDAMKSDHRSPVREHIKNKSVPKSGKKTHRQSVKAH